MSLLRVVWYVLVVAGVIVVCCLLCVVRCLLIVARYLLFVVYCGCGVRGVLCVACWFNV